MSRPVCRIQQTCPSVYDQQRLKFRQLMVIVAKSKASLTHLSPVLPNNVCDFADALMRCPNEHFALAHIRNGIQSAVLLMLLGDALSADAAKGIVHIPSKSKLDQTPFFIFASAVRTRVQLGIKERGNVWTHLLPNSVTKA